MAHVHDDLERSTDGEQTLWSPPQIDEEEAPVVTNDDRVTTLVVTSGSSFELFSGLVAVAVSLAGLGGAHPITLASIATIAVGFALLAQGSTIAARWREATKIAGREHTDAFGIGTEMFGGLAGIILGVLALLGVMPRTLLPAATIVLGSSLLLGAPAQPDIAELATTATTATPRRWHVTRDAARASSGVLVMAGLGAVVMGLLASIGIVPVVTISLVALLCTAAALMMAGGTLFARFTRRHA